MAKKNYASGARRMVGGRGAAPHRPMTDAPAPHAAMAPPVGTPPLADAPRPRAGRRPDPKR